MRIIECDICGRVVDGKVNTFIGEGPVGNEITETYTISVNTHNKYINKMDSHKDIDMCPGCSKNFHDFLQGARIIF